VVPPEYPGRDPEQQQPEAQTVGRDRVRQPRIPVVHPPDQEQHHDDLHECCKTLAVDKDARQLRDREDEDDIEEELEGRDANARSATARGALHRGTAGCNDKARAKSKAGRLRALKSIR